MRQLSGFTHVIVSSGNHDSAVRLGALAELLTSREHIRTRTDRIVDPVELSDEWGPVLVYAVPYLDPEAARHELGGQEPLERSHEAVLGAAMDLVRDDAAVRTRGAAAARTIVMAHAFAAGRAPAQTSDSERDIRVGGVDVVPTDVFDGIDYIALGHLHGPQEPSSEGSGRLRYSGSPLRYSFSEADQGKSVTVVELDQAGSTTVRAVGVPQPRPMAQLAGTLAEQCAEDVVSAHADAWVKVVLTDPGRPDRMFDTLRDRFPHLLSAHHTPRGTARITELGGGGTAVDPMAVVEQFLADALDVAKADPQHVALVRDQYEALGRAEVGA